jgi:homocysteine S-methyltransferase
MKTLQELDLRGLHVLDGGMATELEAKGCNLAGPLWSAHVLETSPETIAEVHREYLEAGADCLLTASYQISVEGFEEIGRSAEDAANALRRTVEIAENVRTAYVARTPRKVWIGASLGPYGATLHNGAEYHGNYDCRFDDLIEFHARRVRVLAETNADFIAFETIPSRAESKAIITALHRYPGVPATMTFTCKDSAHVAHGERLSDCGRLLDEEAQIVGIGVNCTNPKLIRALITKLVPVTNKPIIVYPNSGEHWDVEQRRWVGEGQAERFGDLAEEWRKAGAEWIGGCCRTGPQHIRAVKQKLAEVFALGLQTS